MFIGKVQELAVVHTPFLTWNLTKRQILQNQSTENANIKREFKSQQVLETSVVGFEKHGIDIISYKVMRARYDYSNLQFDFFFSVHWKLVNSFTRQKHRERLVNAEDDSRLRNMSDFLRFRFSTKDANSFENSIQMIFLGLFLFQRNIDCTSALYRDQPLLNCCP